MKTPNWITKLQTRWNVSASQVVIILIVFACTGTSVMVMKPYILQLLAGEDGKTLIASILYYVFILPLYNVMLLFFGFVFGQFRFFWEFEKRFFRRIFRRNKA